MDFRKGYKASPADDPCELCRRSCQEVTQWDAAPLERKGEGRALQAAARRRSLLEVTASLPLQCQGLGPAAGGCLLQDSQVPEEALHRSSQSRGPMECSLALYEAESP